MGNTKNLSDNEGIEKLKDLVDDIKTCLFCTNITDIPFKARPMATLDVDDEGNLWFFSNKASDKNDEMKNNDAVQLVYAKNSSNEFLVVNGKAELVNSKEKIDELWTSMAKAWFPEGKDDPNISVIKIIPKDAHYWDTINGKVITLFKIATAVITGNPSDVGVEGKISV